MLLIFSLLVLVLSRDPITANYSSQAQLEQRTNSLLSNYRFRKNSCYNNISYKYMTMGSPMARLSALIVCNEHARELITAQLCVNWMETQSLEPDGIDGYFIVVIYNGNLRREEIINDSEACVRKDENNVDLNRNFPTDFNALKAGKDDEVYPGVMPLSETMSECIEEIVERIKPSLYLDFHSGQLDAYHQMGVNSQNQIYLLKNISQVFFDDKLQINTLQSIGETINGNIFADLKVRKGLPYSFLIEVFKNYNEDTCFGTFNVAKKEDINTITTKFGEIISYIFRAVKKVL